MMSLLRIDQYRTSMSLLVKGTHRYIVKCNYIINFSDFSISSLLEFFIVCPLMHMHLSNRRFTYIANGLVLLLETGLLIGKN